MNSTTMRCAAPAAGLVVMTLGAAAHAGVVTFDDLTLGDQYMVGDTETSDGVGLSFQEFFWSSGQGTVNGHSEVWNQLWAGGSGLDLETNNINVAFDFGGSVTDLSLLYGEYGGNENIRINGDFRNTGNFEDIDGQVVGGVLVTIVNLGGSLRRMELTGTVDSFVIGGQELWIDDVRYTIPAPGGLALLALGAIGRRRRRAAA